MSIIQSGLILNLDAGNTSSYPGTGTIWTDLSGNNNNGTLIGGPTFNSANGGSIVFDGVDNRIDCPNITVGTQGTINIWFIQDSLVPNKGLVSLGNGYYYLGGSGANVVAGIYSGSKYGPFSGPINATIWSNITYQWNGTTYSLYYNGVFISSDTNSLPTSGALKIGVYPNNTNPFNGRISQVQVYNRALSAAEISQNYDATKGRYSTIIQSGLILNLDAGNTSSYIGTGTVWTDLSGNNNNGTLVNTPTFNSANLGSIVFDGNDDYANIINPSVLQSQNFSVSVWINPSAATNVITSLIDYDHAQTLRQGWVIQSSDATTNRYYYLAYWDGTTFQPSAGAPGIGVQTTNFIWQNLTYIKNGTSVIGYLNGVQLYTATASNATILYLPNRNLAIGKVISTTVGNRSYNGKVSTTQIYNRALSATEVLQNYNNTKGRYSTTALSGTILHLDAGNITSYPKTGIIWKDLSVNGNIGTLINAPTFDYANGGSIVFDGIDDYASISGPNFFTTPNPNLSQAITTPTFDVAPWYPVYDNFTYEFVCKPTSGATIVAQSTTGTPGTSGQRYITNANKSTDGQNNGNFVISVGTNVIQVFDHGDAYMPCLLSYTVNISSTVHIVITVVNKQPSLYINGVFIKTGLTSPKTKVELSARGATVNTSVYGRFSGNINIYKYHNRVLSSQEILQNYNDTKGRYETTVQSCLILNLDAGNTSSYLGTGTLWTDLSGNNNHGTLVNGPTFNSGDGGSITFSNTSNQSVSGTIILSPSFTVEVIFMPITMGDYAPVFTVGLNNGSGSWGDFVLHTTATGAIYCGTDIATRLTPSDTGCGPGTFLVNNIYHMTFTFSGGIGSLYKNGVLLKSKVMTKPLNGSTPGPYRIQNISGFASSMRVYDFRIHCKALTSEEVQQNYKPTTPDCGITADIMEVFPNSATTIFTALYETTCAGGAISDGITTGMTTTKVGKDGVDRYLITAIPSKGSTFKGWNENGRRTGLTRRYVITTTQLSVNFTIRNNTTWFAIFNRDCSYNEVPFCFSTNITNLCLSCEEQKTVYFDNKNDTYINNGITNNTYWYGNSKLETLITFTSVSTTTRVGWSFNLSSVESSGGGTFKEVSVFPYENSVGCDRDLVTKRIAIKCTPTNLTTPYFIFLYKNDEKYLRFDKIGNTEFVIPELEIRGNPNNSNNVYKFKYASYNNQSISFEVLTKTTWEHSTYGPFCNGGYTYYWSTVKTRATTAGIISPDGYYSQLVNGQYSNYAIIYRVYEGQIIEVKNCRSDILDCRG